MWRGWGQRSERGSKCLEKNPVHLWQVPLCKKYELQRKAGAWGKHLRHDCRTSPSWVSSQINSSRRDVCKVSIYDTLFSCFQHPIRWCAVGFNVKESKEPQEREKYQVDSDGVTCGTKDIGLSGMITSLHPSESRNGPSASTLTSVLPNSRNNSFLLHREWWL